MNNNIPAFPSHGSVGELYIEGMTLRDYFAAKALVAVFSRNAPNMSIKDYAMDSYKLADAMLKEREKYNDKT